jgi:uncharacterized protein (TIGR03083 family)
MTEVADHYRTARLRITELVLALDDEDLTRAVPACPGWTVHDVVSHITGVADDAVHGRMDGVATEPWTAAQVDRGRGMSTVDLLERWTEQAPVFESLPLPPQAVIDLTTHEQDIRGAVVQPGARDTDEVQFAFELLARRAVEVRGGAGLRVETDGATYGPEDADCTLRGDRYDLFRAMMGRRSLAQLRALDWGGEPPAAIEEVVVFGPAPADIVE